MQQIFDKNGIPNGHVFIEPHDSTEYVSVDYILNIFPDGSFLQNLLKDRIKETNTIKFLKEPVDMILAKE